MPNEAERLQALRNLNLLDTAPSESFDRISRMASQLFDLPIAAVSLTDEDRQWFKSRVGIDHWTIPREGAPCAQVAAETQLLVIPDLLADPCYKDTVLARSGVRFYAGAPLTTREGYGLGAMCVLGLEPREASAAELGALRDLAAMAMAQIELQHAFGRIDPLSGLPNRHQFIEDMQDLARDSAPGERRIGVLLDLARTREIEGAVRALGPSYLDSVVSRSAAALRDVLGPERTLYHVAATQFAFLAPPGAREATYLPVIVERLAEATTADLKEISMKSSVGVAPFFWEGLDPADLLRTLHSAAQDAQQTDTRVALYSPIHDQAHARRHRLMSDFGEALEAADQLALVYQPRVEIETGRCIGAEALIRWRHPELGDVSPGEFVPLIELSSLAQGLTDWVLGTALDQLALWQVDDPAFQLSVNISAMNLQDAGFAERVTAAVAAAKLIPGTLELEITESAMMQDRAALAQLEALSTAGIRLAIDDFGTGYSNFAYLQTLPVSVVKIDQSFVRDIVADPVRRKLVTTMTDLSHSLGYRVVAEGVETPEALAILQTAGCDEAQGFHIARPMGAAQLVPWRNAYEAAERSVAAA